MIKIHNDNAAAAMIALRWLLAQGMSMADIAQAVERALERRGANATEWDRWILNEAQQMRITRRGFDLNTGIGELGRTLYGTPERQGGNLIESLANILRGDFPRNRFSQETITRLREVLLLPDEVAATHAIDESNIHCSGCGQRFYDGDALTLRGAAFVCNRCAPIHNVKCAHASCEERSQIRNWNRVMQQDKCGIHKNPVAATATATTTATPVLTEGDVLNVFGEIPAGGLRQFLNEMDRGVAAVAQPTNPDETRPQRQITWERLANAAPRRRP